METDKEKNIGQVSGGVWSGGGGRVETETDR